MEKSYHLPASSPLETLVRRTSSRKAVRAPEVAVYTPPHDSQDLSVYSDAGSLQATPTRQARRPPSSPLLHTQFRSSTATEASYFNNQYAHSDYDPSGTRHPSYNDGASVYSKVTFPRNSARDTYDPYHVYEEYGMDDQEEQQQTEQHATYQPDELPAVVVSTPPADYHHSHNTSVTSLSGRVPSKMPATNFSRPVRPSMESLRSSDSKLQVLQRNANRSKSTTAAPQVGMLTPASNSSYGTPPSALDRSRSTGDIRSAAHPFSPYTPSTLSASTAASPQTLSPPGTATANGFTSPNDPSSRRGDQSPVSLYSSYSYYPYEGQVASPTTPKTPEVTVTPPQSSPSSTPQPMAPPSDNAKPVPGSPQYYLLEGIEHHENNRLTESAQCFERSAKESGGCGAGMLMWGLSLRHGWGCEKNEKSGFGWLRKAAELALDDLQVVKGDARNVVKSELVVAIYEVGQCFFQGWGVKQDQRMAVNYFKTAANLGDSDAQQDLAFCLANGKGCKKDKREAAKWYRAAVAQGASDVGLAWIFKEKYR
ncbi:HCP-like protein [Heliocybe sulcata]|uniref:HCP-like protein n=1 Tax=Heliocybe sulcata TaxID=5364 RepID=A0A5C3MSQ0_9AGAM|nr:HCP-like protein [Heliocybe sulcata]